MGRFTRILFNVVAVIAIALGAVLAVVAFRHTDADIYGLPGIAVLMFAIVVCVIVMLGLALGIDRPWRKDPDFKPQDWPYYVAAGLAMPAAIAITFLPAWLPAGGALVSGVSAVGPFLMLFSGTIATIPARRRRAWRSAGQCPACGYDLRETPERCPECGATTPVVGDT